MSSLEFRNKKYKNFDEIKKEYSDTDLDEIAKLKGEEFVLAYLDNSILYNWHGKEVFFPSSILFELGIDLKNIPKYIKLRIGIDPFMRYADQIFPFLDSMLSEIENAEKLNFDEIKNFIEFEGKFFKNQAHLYSYKMGFTSDEWKLAEQYAKNNNCSEQDAVEQIIKNEFKFEFRGRMYKDLNHACIANGLSEKELNHVIKRCNRFKCTKQEALEYVLKRTYTFCFRDKMYRSSKEACNALSISYPIMLFNSENYDISHQESMELLLRDEAFEVNGQRYRSVLDACEELNVDVRYLAEYLAYNTDVSVSSAVDYCMKPRFEFRGKVFCSVKQACREYHIKYYTLQNYKYANKLSMVDAMEKYLQMKGK